MSTNNPNLDGGASTPAGAPGGRKTYGIVSLVLGLVGILLSFFIAIIGIVAGIIAIVFGVLSRRSEPAARGLSLGGLITGIVAIVIGIVSIILAAVLLSQGAAVPVQ